MLFSAAHQIILLTQTNYLPPYINHYHDQAVSV